MHVVITHFKGLVKEQIPFVYWFPAVGKVVCQDLEETCTQRVFVPCHARPNSHTKAVFVYWFPVGKVVCQDLEETCTQRVFVLCQGPLNSHKKNLYSLPLPVTDDLC